MVHCPCCDTDGCSWKWLRFLFPLLFFFLLSTPPSSRSSLSPLHKALCLSFLKPVLFSPIRSSPSTVLLSFVSLWLSLASAGTSFARWLRSSSGAFDNTARVWGWARVCVCEGGRAGVLGCVCVHVRVRDGERVRKAMGVLFELLEDWACRFRDALHTHRRMRQKIIPKDKLTLPHPLYLTCISLSSFLLARHYTLSLLLKTQALHCIATRLRHISWYGDRGEFRIMVLHGALRQSLQEERGKTFEALIEGEDQRGLPLVIWEKKDWKGKLEISRCDNSG